MTPETEQKLARVRKYSTGLRRLFNFSAFIVAMGSVLTLLIVLTRHGATDTMAAWDLEFTGDEITWPLRILVTVWVLIVFGITIKLLRHLAALFDLYSKGQIFTADNVYQIRQIGNSLILFFVGSVYSMLAKLILIALDQPLPAAPSGAEPIGIEVNGPLLLIVSGIMIIVISWIMDVGRELREEADLTV
jgi:hypothetical protein